VSFLGRVVTTPTWHLTPLVRLKQRGGLQQLEPNQKPCAGCPPILMSKFRYHHVFRCIQRPKLWGTGEDRLAAPRRSPASMAAAAPEAMDSMPVRPTGPWPIWFAERVPPVSASTSKQEQIRKRRDTPGILPIIWVGRVSLSPSMTIEQAPSRTGTARRGLRACISRLKQRSPTS